MNDLLETIKAADKIVTFNGLNFDFLVLEQHHGLDRGVGSRPSNVDLSRVVEERIGRVTTLDELVQLNLNERKVHAGEFEHDPVDRTDAIAACRSDVRQIYRLWMLFLADRLKFPSN
ncbi:MAG: hypothetical protein DVB31_01960 [Verrucomicrobia bacterium]|nr:MAG: hypothetical protein DVB31_01960 [Verrucomicrobiota bacterium]